MTDDPRSLPPHRDPYSDPYVGRYAAPERTWYGATVTEERPAAPPPPPPLEPRRHTGGWRRRAAAGATVLAVAVGSGTAGAAIALRADDSPTATSVTAAPVSGGSLPAEQLARVAAAVAPSVVSIAVRGAGGSGEGSGVVLRSDGTILTNNHVIASAADGGGSLSVKFNDGRTLAADIVGRDASSDLAVIRARGISNAKPAALGSVDDVNVGDSVLAIGSPLGLEGSVSAGIVSALHRPVGLGGGAQLSDAIQTDAAINPGNSGGALVDAQGRVIGINTAIATLGGGGRGGQAGSIGLGFAIPVDEAKRVSDQLVKGQQPTRAVLGVQAADAPDGGALVDAVTPGSAAERAGLRSGDVVVSVDGRTVDDAAALTAAIRSHDPGQEVRITVKRGGSERTIRATLGSARG